LYKPCVREKLTLNLILNHINPMLVLTFYFFKYPFSFYLLTYLRTPWSRVLLKKLTVSQLVKKFPTFYGTRRFIAALTSARHVSLS